MRITNSRSSLAALAFSTLAACAVAGNQDSADDAGAVAVDAGSDRDHGGDVASGEDSGFSFDSGGHDAASGNDASGNDAAAPDAAAPDAGVDSAVDAGVDSAVDAGADSAAADSGADAPTSDGGCVAFTGVLATYNLASQLGSEASAPATSSATGVTAGAITRAPGLTAVTGSGSINASGWPTTATADATKYYTFTIQAPGCTVDITSLALDVRASTTGPTNGNVATSADAFAAHSANFAGTSTPTVTLSASASGTIEVRVYGFGASSSGGTFRIANTVTVSGSIN